MAKLLNSGQTPATLDKDTQHIFGNPRAEKQANQGYSHQTYKAENQDNKLEML